MKIFALILLFCNLVLAANGSEKGIRNLPKEFQDEAKQILAEFQAYQAAKGPGDLLSIDLDDNTTATTYNKAGIFSPEQCAADQKRYKTRPADQCQVKGTVDNKSEVSTTGYLDFRIENDEEGEKVLRSYVEVQWTTEENGEKKVHSGWIPQEYTSYKPVSPSYSEIISGKASSANSWLKDRWAAICKSLSRSSASPPTPAASSNLKDISNLSQAINKDLNAINKQRKNVSDIAEALSSSVGQCVLNPPNKAPTQFKNSIVYDQYALPTIKKASVPKNVVTENGPITAQNMQDIDALARTMFAEMASCTPIGAQYPMAVARVALNRQEAMKKNPATMDEFIKNNSEHDSHKSLLSKAITSPVLFTAWNEDMIDFDALDEARDRKAVELRKAKRISPGAAAAEAKKLIQPDAKRKSYYKKNETGLLHTLCPPSDPNSPCYTGQKPDKNLATVWQNTLKVATEAVLFPEQFKAKTAELGSIKHYTSNRKSFYDFIQVHPKIEGRAISSTRCLNLWRPMTDAEKAAKATAGTATKTPTAKKKK